MVQRTEQSFAHYQNTTHQDTQANTNTSGDRFTKTLTQDVIKQLF